MRELISAIHDFHLSNRPRPNQFVTILSKHAELNQLDVGNDHGMTALGYAVYLGHFHCVWQLIQWGANIQTPSTTPDNLTLRSPIEIAAAREQNMIQFFLKICGEKCDVSDKLELDYFRAFFLRATIEYVAKNPNNILDRLMKQIDSFTLADLVLLRKWLGLIKINKSGQLLEALDTKILENKFEKNSILKEEKNDSSSSSTRSGLSAAYKDAIKNGSYGVILLKNRRNPHSQGWENPHYYLENLNQLDEVILNAITEHHDLITTLLLTIILDPYSVAKYLLKQDPYIFTVFLKKFYSEKALLDALFHQKDHHLFLLLKRKQLLVLVKDTKVKSIVPTDKTSQDIEVTKYKIPASVCIPLLQSLMDEIHINEKWVFLMNKLEEKYEPSVTVNIDENSHDASSFVKKIPTSDKTLKILADEEGNLTEWKQFLQQIINIANLETSLGWELHDCIGSLQKNSKNDQASKHLNRLEIETMRYGIQVQMLDSTAITQSKKSLTHLPKDLLLLIASYLNSSSDLHKVCQLSKYFQSLILTNPTLALHLDTGNIKRDIEQILQKIETRAAKQTRCHNPWFSVYNTVITTAITGGSTMTYFSWKFNNQSNEDLSKGFTIGACLFFLCLLIALVFLAFYDCKNYRENPSARFYRKNTLTTLDDQLLTTTTERVFTLLSLRHINRHSSIGTVRDELQQQLPKLPTNEIRHKAILPPDETKRGSELSTALLSSSVSSSSSSLARNRNSSFSSHAKYGSLNPTDEDTSEQKYESLDPS